MTVRHACAFVYKIWPLFIGFLEHWSDILKSIFIICFMKTSTSSILLLTLFGCTSPTKKDSLITQDLGSCIDYSEVKDIHPMSHFYDGEIHLAPYFNGSSNFIGYVCLNVKSGSTYDQLGFKIGDVITKIDNHLTSKSLAEFKPIFSKVKKNSFSSVEIRRCNKYKLEKQLHSFGVPSCKSKAEWIDCKMEMKKLAADGNLPQFETYFNSICLNKNISCEKLQVSQQAATATMLSKKKANGSAYQIIQNEKATIFIINPVR